MLPISGYPFGPGGYGGLLFFCHFQIRVKDAAAQSDAASRVSLSTISRGERLNYGRFGRRGVIGLIRPTPALYSVSEK